MDLHFKGDYMTLNIQNYHQNSKWKAYNEEGEWGETFESFPLSTCSHDCGFKVFRCASLQDSDGKNVFMGHNSWTISKSSTIIFELGFFEENFATGMNQEHL